MFLIQSTNLPQDLQDDLLFTARTACDGICSWKTHQLPMLQASCFISKEMRCLRDENGKRIFTVEEFLRPQQISSFFSRMACKRRDATDSDDEAEEFARQQAAVHSDVMEALQQDVTHPLLFCSKNLCLMTESEIKSLKITQMRSMASHFSIKVKGRKKQEYSGAIIVFLNRCSCKQ